MKTKQPYTAYAVRATITYVNNYKMVTIFYKFMIFNAHSLYTSYEIHFQNRTDKYHKLIYYNLPQLGIELGSITV